MTTTIQPYLLKPDGSYPNGMTPERLAELGLTPVHPSPPPPPQPGHVVVDAEPELVAGQYHQRWAQQAASPEAPVDPKLAGIEFQGVMCSATSQDQSGLMAVMLAVQLQGAAFKPTRFEFENGNSLVLGLDNFQSFVAVWMPFRQSFFQA